MKKINPSNATQIKTTATSCHKPGTMAAYFKPETDENVNSGIDALARIIYNFWESYPEYWNPKSIAALIKDHLQ